MKTHRELKDAYYRLKVKFNNGTITQDERIEMGSLQKQIVKSKNVKMRQWDIALDNQPIPKAMQLIIDDLNQRQKELNDSIKDHVKRNPTELFELNTNPTIPLTDTRPN